QPSKLPDMHPRFKLRDYRFLDLSIRWIQSSGRPTEQTPAVVISDGAPKGTTDRVVALKVSLAPPAECSGYQIALSITGLLSVEPGGEEIDEENLRSLAVLNGAMILYGIVRAEVASMTSNFPGGRLLLPTVYMQEILKNQA